MSGFFEQAKSKVCLSEGTRATMRPLVSTWEQRKLSEVATFGGGHTPPIADPDNYEDGYVLWVTSQDVKSNYLDRTTTQITEKGAKELTLYPAGSLVMVTRSGILRHTLPVAELRKPSTVNQDIRVILPQGECCGEWLLQFFISHNKELLLEFGKTGTTVESVDFGKIKDMLLHMPSTVEQQQIGNHFAKLDRLITLHQRKYDKLAQLKKSMLDKMFPKPGERFPEIRFAGFTDPWEQRKLGDVATIVGGGTPSTNNDAYWDGDIDWYSPAELGEQVYADRSVRRITQAGYDSCSATLLPAGKTILFTSRAGIGNTAILRRSACTNQGFQSLVVNDDTDVYFVYSMTDRIKKFAEQKASGSTFLEISGKGLAAGEFVFPSKDEQTAIGSMFKQLDTLITLHQRKLELLRNTKKSLLDRMFV